MTIKLHRLLVAPALAGALLGAALGASTQGTVEAAGPRWKPPAKPAGVDCSFSFFVKKLKDNSNIEDLGSVCATKVTHTNWISIKQQGKNNQANGAIFSLNIVQINNVPDGNNPKNKVKDIHVGFDDDGELVQANVNVNNNYIKDNDPSDEVIDIDIAD